jgi:hypothetical protein
MNIRFIPILVILLGALAGADLAQAACPIDQQCVAYARARSGIYTNRVGANGSAYDWYRLAESRDATSSKPKAGRVMILEPWSSNPYGHALYVEKAEKDEDDKYDVRLSHRNYDWNCSIETNAKARYYRDKQRVKFKSGVWTDRKFAVAGFIKD